MRRLRASSPAGWPHQRGFRAGRAIRRRGRGPPAATGPLPAQCGASMTWWPEPGAPQAAVAGRATRPPRGTCGARPGRATARSPTAAALPPPILVLPRPTAVRRRTQPGQQLARTPRTRARPGTRSSSRAAGLPARSAGTSQPGRQPEPILLPPGRWPGQLPPPAAVPRPRAGRRHRATSRPAQGPWPQIGQATRRLRQGCQGQH